MNKVALIGRLGGDVELKSVSGTNVANFSLATDESWKDKDGVKQSKTEWHKIVAWGKTGEVLSKFFSKGDPIYLEGSIHTRSWEDKDGVKRYSTEVKASSFEFLPKPQEKQESFDNTEFEGVPL